MVRLPHIDMLVRSDCHTWEFRLDPEMVGLACIDTLVRSGYGQTVTLALPLYGSFSNRVAKPVLLNTINPMFENIFFRPKGGGLSFFGHAGPPLPLFSENSCFLQSS